MKVIRPAFLSITLLSTLASGIVSAASPVAVPSPMPLAVATVSEAQYCFERIRQLEVERNPPSYLVLNLKLKVTYRNPGARPLIIPLEHERTVYTALRPGAMRIFKEVDVFEPTMKMMKDLPPKADPNNPAGGPSPAFGIIPAGGDLIASMQEEMSFPVNHKNIFHRDPDLRGKRLYVRLSLLHQELSPELEASLSDRWTRFGVPWTGELLTNVITVDVPQQTPASRPCTDGQPATRF